MTKDQAETAVTASALIVGGIYVYRRVSGELVVRLTTSGKEQAKRLAGIGPPLPTGPFVVGWGFTFLCVALLAQASPKLGGTFAMLVATGSVLGNGQAVVNNVNKQLGSGSAAAANAGGGANPSSGAQTPPAGTYYPRVVVPQGWTRVNP